MYRALVATAILVLANGVSSTIVEPRIIGGEKSSIESYAYMVSVQVFDTHVCGGAILTRKNFVTAARCLSPLPSLPYYYKARVGSTSRTKGGKVIVVEKCVQHPNYVTSKHYFDIAIGTLKTPLDFVTDRLTVQPIALVNENEMPKIGDLFIATGWGITTVPKLHQQNNQRDAENLHAVQILYAHRDECRIFDRKDANSRYTWIGANDTLLCAGGAGRTVYRGDDGAPLVNTRRQLAGIATRPHDIPNIRWPGLYANIAHPPIHRFIVQNIKYT